MITFFLYFGLDFGFLSRIKFCRLVKKKLDIICETAFRHFKVIICFYFFLVLFRLIGFSSRNVSQVDYLRLRVSETFFYLVHSNTGRGKVQQYSRERTLLCEETM